MYGSDYHSSDGGRSTVSEGGGGGSNNEETIHLNDENYINELNLLERNRMLPDVIYNVLPLKMFFELLPSSSEKEKLLNTIVVSSNYTTNKVNKMIDWINTLFCCQSTIRVKSVEMMLLHHTRSYLTLGEHFSLGGLTEQCEVGLSHAEQSSLEKLAKQLSPTGTCPFVNMSTSTCASVYHPSSSSSSILSEVSLN